MTERQEFEGRRVLVTGGTRGIGQAIADRFVAGGATVAVTSRTAVAEDGTRLQLQADLAQMAGVESVLLDLNTISVESTLSSITWAEAQLRGEASRH